MQGDALHAKGEEHTTENIRVQGLEKHTDERVYETQISWKRNCLASSRLVERYTLIMRVEGCEPPKKQPQSCARLWISWVEGQEGERENARGDAATGRR